MALFHVGLWAFTRGDTATVMRTRQSLAALKSPTGRSWLRNESIVYDDMLGAYLAVARKSTDARARLAQLDSMLRNAPSLDDRLNTLMNSLLADLWERIDDPARALAANRRFHVGLEMGRLSSTRIRREARLLERLDRPREAIVAWRSDVALRANAEPSLQPDLAQAKANLARLEVKVR
ncbi:hypothetical protein [Gemmatimonas sp.]|uniref:hypothetical protein n=1 Tax=Gemmatimonas sp. TaxID=1962908 RepID=UPI003569C3D2